MATHKEFGIKTNGTEVAELFKEQIEGKNIVITGVSPLSLGETLALTIAKYKPATLIFASRTASKVQAVANQVEDAYPSIKPKVVLLDLASQQSVRKAAAEVAELVEKIDLLINNAAIVCSDLRHTTEGIEAQFGTNHIGHFLWTGLLLPQLRAAASSRTPGLVRIINVTSRGHRISPIRFHDYNFEGKPIPEDEEPVKGLPSVFLPKDGAIYSVFVSYGQGKTANVLLSLELDQRLRKEGIRSYAVHPGSIMTDLSRNLTPEDEKVISTTATEWVTRDQGTSSILVAALDPALSQPLGGVYISDCQIAESAPHAADPAAAGKLWALSEELVGQKFV